MEIYYLQDKEIEAWEKFAAFALNGLLSDTGLCENSNVFVIEAAMYADKMMAERAKRIPHE